jgi:TP901 family phage tail tape measure protein
MSYRSVAVRLTARIDQYVAAMNAAKQSTEGFSKSTEANLQKVGTQVRNVGSTMTRGVTLPLVGAGVAALKLSNDFDSAFGQMVGLAGVAAEDVAGLKDEVLKLAGETARAPQELAEALYFASSAGLDTAGAMDAVTVAAQASAAGLGATQDIVGLVASAVASYGEANIDAAEATDILVATIREGRAEPAELAGTLGRVLPIASQLGVSFDEVGATVAYLSNVFGDTNRTVTATQGLFVKLVSPSQQGRDALAEMGTSVEDLNAAISQDGLMGALELLRSKGFAGNQQALRALFDDIEGYQAALALLNADQTQLNDIMAATSSAAGSTQEAFGALDQDAQAMRQAWVDIQIALIRVGEVIGPVVADIAGGIGDAAGAFADLDPWVQKLVIGFAAVAAAAGPLLIAVGSLIRNYTTLRTAVAAYKASEMSASVVNPIAGAWRNLATAIGLAGAAYGSFQAIRAGVTGDESWLEKDVSLFEKPFQLAGRFGFALGSSEGWGAWESVESEWASFDQTAQTLFATMSSGVFTMDQFAERVNAANVDQEVRNRLLILFRAQLDANAESEANYAEAVGDTTTATGEHTEAVSANAVAQQDAARYVAQAEAAYEAEQRAHAAAKEAARQHREALAELYAEIIGGLDTQFDYESATLAMEEAALRFAEEQDKATEALADSTLTDREKELALIDLRQEQIAMAEQALEQAKAYAAEKGAQEGSKYEAQLMREELGRLKAVYPELGELIDEYIAKLNLIPTERVTRIRIESTGTNIIVDENGNVRSGRANGGSVYPGGMYPILERGEPELLTDSTGTYLMTPRPGMVTPMRPVAPSGVDMAAELAKVLAKHDRGVGPLVQVGSVNDYSGTAVDTMLRTASALLVMSS